MCAMESPRLDDVTLCYNSLHYTTAVGWVATRRHRTGTARARQQFISSDSIDVISISISWTTTSRVLDAFRAPHASGSDQRARTRHTASNRQRPTGPHPPARADTTHKSTQPEQNSHIHTYSCTSPRVQVKYPPAVSRASGWQRAGVVIHL